MCQSLFQFKSGTVRGASLQVVQTKVINSKCNYEREKCKTTKRAVLHFDLWVQSHSLTPISSTLDLFLCTCTAPSPPLSCLLLCMLTSQYGVIQRTERLELKKNLRGRAQRRWEKQHLQHLIGESPSVYTLLHTACLFIHTPRILCKPLQRMPLAWKVLSRLFKSSKNKQRTRHLLG